MQDRTTLVHSKVPDPYDILTDLDPDPTRLPAILTRIIFYTPQVLIKAKIYSDQRMKKYLR
jgi:hypothetical protein